MSAWLLSLYLLGTSGQGVLADEDYRFCHEPRYPLYEDERRWCELGGDPNPRCPDLPEACENHVEPGPDGRFSGAWGDGDGSGDGSDAGDGEREGRATPPDGDERKARPKRKQIELPAVLSPIAKLLLIGLVLAGIALIARHILKNRHDDPEDDPDEPVRAPSPEEAQVAAIRAAKETDVTRLLNLARAEASAGRFEAAIEYAYAAALRRLDGDGFIELHHSRTNGDYVRRLRRGQPQLASELRGVVREVEGVQFGARAATRERFDAVLSGVMNIVGRGATALLLLLSLFGLPGCSDGAGDEESKPKPVFGGDTSPIGERALLEAIATQSPKVSYRIEPLNVIAEDVGTLIILPGAGPKDDNWDPILAWVEEGGRLILAGERPTHKDLELFEDPRPTPYTQLFTGYFVGFNDMQGWTLKVPPSPGLLPQIGLTEGESVLYRYLSDDYSDEEVSVYAVGVYRGEGEIIAFENDDFFTNIAMSVEDNARAMATMAHRYDERSVQLCTAWTGSGSSSPLDAMRNADLTPLIVQLLVFVVLLVLYRGIAFGRLRDTEARGRRASVDHVQALGSHYARAQATGHAWQAYAAWALDQIDLRLPGQRRRGLQATASAIAARTQWPETEVITLLIAASDAANRGGPASMRGPASAAHADADEGSSSLHNLQRMAAMLAAMGPSHQGTKPKK